MGLRGPGAKPKPRPPVPRRNRRTVVVPKGNRYQRVVRFIESLPITSGLLAGTRFKVRPWQRDILKGIYRTDTKGQRVVRQALITMPRKQGKTGLTAALALAHLCGPEAEQRGQVYSAAADQAQAALIYAEMKAIIERVPELEKRIIVRDFAKPWRTSRPAASTPRCRPMRAPSTASRPRAGSTTSSPRRPTGSCTTCWPRRPRRGKNP